MQLKYSVVFHGNLPKQEIAKLLNFSDYFLHASLIETFSVVIAEALFTGTPVIASNVGAIPELVNESNGILCENTVESWKAGIEKAMKMNFDSQTISSQIAGKFTSERIAGLFNEVYKSI